MSGFWVGSRVRRALGCAVVVGAVGGCAVETGAPGEDVEASRQIAEALTVGVADGFESGGLAVGGWAKTGDVTVVGTAAQAGTFGARVGRGAYLTTTIDATGYRDLSVSFGWRAVAMDWFEFAAVEWAPPGGTFTELDRIEGTTAWTPESLVLPAAANGTAGVQLRFWVSASDFFDLGWEGIYVDDVVVTGTPGCTTASDCSAGEICVAAACVAHCGDGQQNGDETGLDCGGSCEPCSTVETLFSDDFSGGLGAWTTSPAANVALTSGLESYAGGPSARLSVTSEVRHTLSTVGYEDLELGYVRQTTGLDTGEYFAAEVSTDGATFTTLESVRTGSFSSPQTFVLPEAFEDQPAVTIRFRAVGTALWFFLPEYAVIDSVTLTGSPMATSGCTSNAECAALDGECVVGVCNAGVCETAPAAAGSACGDASDTACDGADSCDGAGSCVDNVASAGAPCGDPASSECDAPDACDGAGVCLPNLEPAGTACGDPAASECDQPDSCDGAGACAPNLASPGTACGDPTVSGCDGADTCDGAGTCQDNNAGPGEPCGDPSASECDAPDICDASGVCQANHRPANSPCGDPSASECDAPDSCDGAGACRQNLTRVGTPCGDASSSTCDGADTCDGAGSCAANYAASGTACGDPTASECNQPDACDGAGRCAANLASPGTPCGDPSSSVCDNPDRCDGTGGCDPSFVPAGTGCGDATVSACDDADTCDGSGACSLNLAPTGSDCGGGRVCDVGDCVDCGGPVTSTFDTIQSHVFDSASYNCTDSICHGNTGSGGLDLRAPDAYSHLYQVPADGIAMNRVEPGDPDTSFLYRKLAWIDGNPVPAGAEMPSGGNPPIRLDELSGIASWITSGAPETGFVPGTLGLLCGLPCLADVDCDNGNPCDGSETCDVATGACQAGAVLDCNDGIECTADRCEPALGCVNELAAGLPCAGGVCDDTGACVGCVPPVNTFDAIQTLVFDNPTYACNTPACHGATPGQAGLDLRAGGSYAELFEAGRNRVVAGDAAASRLYDKLYAKVVGNPLASDGTAAMPQGPYPAITQDQLTGIALWINAGAPETGLVPGTEALLCEPQTAPPANLTELWDFPTSGGITSLPVVDGNVVYTTSWNGFVYALDRTTGTVNWSFDTGARAVQGGVALAPDGSIVFGDGEAVIRRLAPDGTLIWEWSLRRGSYADHIWQTPTIHGGMIYVPIASHADQPCTKGRVMALDLSTGAVLWERDNVPDGVCRADTDIVCTSNADCPGGGTCEDALGGSVTGRIQVDPDGSSIYYNTVGCYTFPSVGDADSIIKLDAATGATVWVERANPTEQFNYCWGSGADCRSGADCGGGLCLPKTFYYDFGFINGPLLVDADDGAGGTRFLVVSASKNGAVYARDAATGAEAWTNVVRPRPVSPNFAAYGLFNGAMTYHDGLLFAALYEFSSMSGPLPDHLQAFSEVNGDTVWTDDIGISWSSVTTSGGTLYAGTQAASEFYAYNAETGARLNTFPLPATTAGPAAFEGGSLFIGYGISGAGGLRAYAIEP